jgi:hypothetical protein
MVAVELPTGTVEEAPQRGPSTTTGPRCLLRARRPPAAPIPQGYNDESDVERLLLALPENPERA